MSPRERISKEARRDRIMAAALQVFAEHGLHGATTRIIADHAGISEALLYRHFESKEALFQAIQEGCLPDVTSMAQRLEALPKTTATLVVVVHLMAASIYEGRFDPGRHRSIKRLMLSSFAGDGVFARGFTQANMGRWISTVVELIRAAEASKDTQGPVDAAAAAVWFTHHLFAMMGIHGLLEPPIAQYGVPKKRLLEASVRFALRGLGLTQKAIDKYYDPAEVERLLAGLAGAAPKEKTHA